MRRVGLTSQRAISWEFRWLGFGRQAAVALYHINGLQSKLQHRNSPERGQEENYFHLHLDRRVSGSVLLGNDCNECS